ncbi:SDR family oxidoreductase [Burkholderia sp. Ac-20353]|uniref:SDR family NAD(P)-dependent oxidoreductase n=1 Tax=Burkholderia sp. Ac-20353 TaxID=2703894 RepID=UPI00197C0AEB|nr:SDR family oxidoreductase [Burkholderia sp. Ac-20353]MBN3789133.1 SDR family oxidoreductase [Burkholderia sp. Ac-20353]
MKILEGKTALVTGAGHGLGKASALAYAKYGAHVFVNDIDRVTGEETVSEIEAAGGEADFVLADVTSPQQIQAMIDVIVQKKRRLDIAFNNAGIAPLATPVADYSDQEWSRVIRMDLDSVFYCARAEINAMLATGGGVIVNMASILGQVAFPGLAPYTAAKHGVIGLTRQIAVDYAALGIRAFSVGPAFMKTGLEAGLAETSRNSLAQLHPAGRMGEPEEVGEVVALLSSTGASFVNGGYIPIDGGFLSR